MSDDRRAKHNAYKREYLANNPDKKDRHREMARELMRRKRLDPEYKVEEKVRNELRLAKKEERDGGDN